MKLEDLALDPELLWLVVFGPGFGESIVLAVPGGAGSGRPSWIAVDSLRQQRDPEDVIPAFELLRAHKAKLSAAVLSHPHADHVGGFARLLDLREPGSPLGCLAKYVDAGSDWQLDDDAGAVLSRGAADVALNRIDDVWRREPESRWDLLAGERRSVEDAELEILHPSRLPRARPRDLNKVSSPIQVSWKECRILLGADLLQAGWRAIGRAYAATGLDEAGALKAAHHGSAGAQHPLAIGEPPPTDRLCVVTPFNRGRPLPDYSEGEGVERLLRSHELVGVTALPAGSGDAPVSRAALTPRRGSFGELRLSHEPASRSPREAWLAVAFDADGAEVHRLRGDAAGWVVD